MLMKAVHGSISSLVDHVSFFPLSVFDSFIAQIAPWLYISIPLLHRTLEIAINSRSLFSDTVSKATKQFLNSPLRFRIWNPRVSTIRLHPFFRAEIKIPHGVISFCIQIKRVMNHFWSNPRTKTFWDVNCVFKAGRSNSFASQIYVRWDIRVFGTPFPIFRGWTGTWLSRKATRFHYTDVFFSRRSKALLFLVIGLSVKVLCRCFSIRTF